MPVVNTGLVESTRNRLRYLLTDTAVSPPIVDNLTLLNRGGAALTDLQTDLIAAMAGAAGGDGVSGAGLREVLMASTNGYPVGTSGTLIIAVGVALTQAQARALLNSDDPGGILTNPLLPRARMTITPRTGTAQWQVDATFDAVSGDPTAVVSVLGAVNLGVATAILDIFFRDSRNL